MLWAFFLLFLLVLLLILYSYFMVDLHSINDSISGGQGGSRPMCAYSRAVKVGSEGRDGIVSTAQS